ncbi:3-isopropylmalate dehydratase small subunit [Anabaena subtropica]|uniref:3-isopropylmalate dehydratase n=1 Tax=Anabaena subtropica FACHB-260 TaxID=2692884 RepID=A0ABR8CJM9_9NOST|nr:isopropylmalate isomerase [Anabaena subtropica]MBD2342710.1 isopropylmalate isomerase [Anabaena subtropica FACHB-260]
MKNNKSIISATAISIHGDDIDTDRILPARFVKTLVFDKLGQYIFADERIQKQQQFQIHPLDNPVYADAQLMFVNKNFGCGSSREHAPQGIKRWGKGIKAIIGESFAEIFFGNCNAIGLLCLTASTDILTQLINLNKCDPQMKFHLDIQSLTIACENNKFPVWMPEGLRQNFLSGHQDSLLELLSVRQEIINTAERVPYFQYLEA